ncbi:hypothetical protein GCM10007908_30230 [Rhizobium albus]|nr:hypothetical protein GCM10007908_30230 [Rhizobium albus]
MVDDGAVFDYGTASLHDCRILSSGWTSVWPFEDEFMIRMGRPPPDAGNLYSRPGRHRIAPGNMENWVWPALQA